MSHPVDFLVVGAGFYGGMLALDFKQRHPDSSVVVLEREARPMRRASLVNQARVHNGYHYPRSFTTGYRSRLDFARFVSAWPEAIVSDFTKLYAISRLNSKVTPSQFKRHCQQIGAELRPASEKHLQLFNPRLVAEVAQVREYAFDAEVLADSLFTRLAQLGVEVKCEQEVRSIKDQGDLVVVEAYGQNSLSQWEARAVRNCTYSGLTQLKGLSFPDRLKLKHEITEMGLFTPPPELEKVGVTMMDGSFFSFMPYPSASLHSLTHVRYTPHLSWIDQEGINPYQRLCEYHGRSRVTRMIRDAARYLPLIEGAQFDRSLWEVKTILVNSELDDGRPILEVAHWDGKVKSCLGGKIDNIFELF